MTLYFLLGAAIVYSVASTYFCIKFALTLLRVQDSLQESLDTIEEKHESISEILSRPLFFDSPEVRQVLKDIESTRDSLIKVANDLTDKIENKEEEDIISDEG